MNHPDIQSALQTALENEIHPDQIRLWPAVAQRLAVGKRPLFKQGDASMNTIFSRTALILLAIIVGFALLFATPQGQAFAKNLLQFFTRTPGDTIPAPTPQPLRWTGPHAPKGELTPLPSPTGFAFADDCGNPPVFKCSVAQVRQKVHFTIKELSSIPAGLYFIGATGGPQMVIILYNGADNGGGLSLIQQPWNGRPEQTAWEVGASAVVETVQIGAATGEYVKGSYIYKAGDANEVWDATLDSQSLHWVQDGIFFQMSASGPQVDKAGLIALAKNLTTSPVSARPSILPTETPDPDVYVASPYTLTIPEAEKRAGFAIHQPGLLPDSLPFQGAMVDENDLIVRMEYQSEFYKSQNFINGLTLSQQVAPNPADCHLCGMLVGDNKLMEQDQNRHLVVSPKSNLETVKIGALTGQYVEGHWIGSDCCGWIWTKEDIKTLRWWKDGMAFELVELGGDVTRMDMIKIAESIE